MFTRIIMFGIVASTLIQSYCRADLLLISGLEQSMEPLPIVVYKIEDNGGPLEKVAELPALRGTRTIDFDPEGNYLAAWQYTDNALPNGLGQVCVLNLKEPDDIEIYPLPFAPVYGGFFSKDKSGNLVLITEVPTVDLQPMVLSLSKRKLTACAYEEVPWSENISRGPILTPGGIELGGAQILRFGIDFSTGILKLRLWEKRFDSDIVLDNSFLEEVEPLSPAYVQLLCANLSTSIFKFVQIDENRKQKEVWWYIYNKQNKKWSKLHCPSTAAYTQIYAEWIVRANDVQEQTTQGDSHPERVYSFYTLDGEHRFDWKTEAGDTVIAVIEDRILHRQADTLRATSFTEDGVIESSTHIMCVDEKLWTVFWALFASD